MTSLNNFFDDISSSEKKFSIGYKGHENMYPSKGTRHQKKMFLGGNFVTCKKRQSRKKIEKSARGKFLHGHRHVPSVLRKNSLETKL